MTLSIIKRILFLIAFASLHQGSHAQVTQVWKDYYHHSHPFHDRAIGIETDDDGNYYMIGGFRLDTNATFWSSMGIARFDTNRTKVYESFYHTSLVGGPVIDYAYQRQQGLFYILGEDGFIIYETNGQGGGHLNHNFSHPEFIATDTSGNVYVAGADFFSGDFDLVIQKWEYQSGGYLQSSWTRNFDGSFGDDDTGTQIIVDPGGNSYVAGSYSDGFVDKGLIVKYDPTGTLLYAYQSPYLGIVSDMVLDPNGDIYILMERGATAKLNNAGILQWTHPHSYGLLWDASSMISDGAGNYYMVGNRSLPTQGWNCVVTKMNASGTELWTTEFDTLTNADEQAFQMELGPDGYLYLSGQKDGDFLVSRLDTAGNVLWISTADGTANGIFDRPYHLWLGTDGELIVTGEMEMENSGLDMMSVVFDTAGNRLDSMELHSGSGFNQYINAVAADPMGNAFICGEGTQKMFNTRYDSTGREIFTDDFSLGSSGSSSNDALAVIASPNGRSTITGYADNDSFPVATEESVTIQYDLAGNRLWVDRFVKEGFRCHGQAVIDDPSGNVYVASVCTDDSLHIRKIDLAGNLLWTRAFLSPSPLLNYELPKMEVEGDHLFVYSDFGSNVQLQKISLGGVVKWSNNWEWSPSSTQTSNSLYVDSLENVWIGGIGSGVPGVGAFMVKFDSSGTEFFRRSWNPYVFSNFLSKIALDGDGQVYLALTGGSPYGSLVRLDSAYNIDWSSDGGPLICNDFFIDPYNNKILIGIDTTTKDSIGIAIYNAQDSLIYYELHGEPNAKLTVRSTAMAPDNSVYIAVDKLRGNNSPMLFRYRVRGDGSITGGLVEEQIEPGSQVKFSWSPGSMPTVYSQLDYPAMVSWQLFDINGKRVGGRDLGEQPSGTLSHEIPVDNTFADGIYILIWGIGDQYWTKKFIIP